MVDVAGAALGVTLALNVIVAIVVAVVVVIATRKALGRAAAIERIDRSVQAGMSAASIHTVDTPVSSTQTWRSRSVAYALISSMKNSE